MHVENAPFSVVFLPGFLESVFMTRSICKKYFYGSGNFCNRVLVIFFIGEETSVII